MTITYPLSYSVLGLQFKSKCRCDFCKIQKTIYDRINSWVTNRASCHNTDPNQLGDQFYSTSCRKCGRRMKKRTICKECKGGMYVY